MSEWIPVEERLPEMNVNVLVYYKSDLSISIDRRTNYCHVTRGWTWVKSLTDSVSHWMPLPKSPKTKCIHEIWEKVSWIDMINDESYLVFLNELRRSVYLYCPFCGEKADGRKNS